MQDLILMINSNSEHDDRYYFKSIVSQWTRSTQLLGRLKINSVDQLVDYGVY